MEYGPNARDIEADLAPEEMNKRMELFIQNTVNIASKEKLKVKQQTKDQSQSKLWKEERKKRLTTSNFGCVMKRNQKLKMAPLVKNILYSDFHGNKFTRLGIEKEDITIKEYISYKKEQKDNVKVERMGLVIGEDFPFLAGSPDGKVTDQMGNVGLIEIKNVLYNKPVSLTQAAKLKSISNFCLHFDPKSKKLAVKKNHNYYYQCLGLLLVCNMDWIDFVVRMENPYELHVERLTFDKDLINEMLEKLKSSIIKLFYQKLWYRDMENFPV